MEKATAEELTKFIQFGCWNNINKDGCLENVMKKLNEYVTDVKQDFIVVTGDNYYPQKEKNKDKDKDKNKNKETVDGEPVVKEKKKEKKEKKETVDGEPVVEKKKIIMFKDIDHGFQLLPTNIPIYTILGNHDLETFDAVKQNLFVDSDEPRRAEFGCEIVNKQIKTIRALPNISYEFFKSVKLANNTLLLMIDTSIYEKPENSNKYLPCYQKFAELNSVALPAETIDTLRAYQLTKIQEAIGTNSFSNIIIAGHHPIQQLKFKNGEDRLITDIEYFKVVLQEIYSLTPTSKFYYLCSDLHLYQEGTIHLPVDTGTMNIKQYIVGTGGTELDSMPLGNSGNELYNEITTIKECGVLACDVSGLEPTFTFITAPATNLNTNLTAVANLTSAADASEIIGGKRKRRSKKYKSGTRRRRRNTRKKHKKR
jgi:Icc-related predicted phosphoesterase